MIMSPPSFSGQPNPPSGMGGAISLSVPQIPHWNVAPVSDGGGASSPLGAPSGIQRFNPLLSALGNGPSPQFGGDDPSHFFASPDQGGSNFGGNPGTMLSGGPAVTSSMLSGLLGGKLFGSAPLWGGNSGESSGNAGGGIDHNFLASIINQLIGGKLFGSSGVWGGGGSPGLFGMR